MIAPFGPTLEMVGKLRPTKSFCWLKKTHKVHYYGRKRGGEGVREREEERIGKEFLVYVVHMHVQQRELS